MRFRPAQHLRRQNDIRAVREQGRRIECRAFTLWWKRRAPVPASTETAGEAPTRAARPAPPPGTPRVCVIASTAAVGHAVLRNRAKRRLRELFRQHQHLVPADCDLLLIARAATVHADLADLRQRFDSACSQIAKS